MATIAAPNYPKLAVPSAAAASLRSRNSILNRHGNGCIGYKPSVVAFKSSLWSKDLILNRLCNGYPEYKLSVAAFSSSLHLNPMLSSNIDTQNKVDVLPKRLRSLSPPRAYKDDVFRFQIPTITEKPEWWWRTLACVPYLIALQISDVGFFLQPFLEHHEAFENLIYFVPGAIRRLPPWFTMIYCYFGFIGVVKNKDLPHYIRFHMMMGMLLETALQLIWCTSNFFPLIHYNGRFGMYYWAGIGFGYILALLECVRRALSAKYAHIPFISDAAFMHTLCNIRSFQRPF